MLAFIDDAHDLLERLHTLLVPRQAVAVVLHSLNGVATPSARDLRHWWLWQSDVGAEGQAAVGQRTYPQLVGEVLQEPGVLQQLLDRYSLRGIRHEDAAHEVLARW